MDKQETRTMGSLASKISSAKEINRMKKEEEGKKSHAQQ